jgi:hypothetical protein
MMPLRATLAVCEDDAQDLQAHADASQAACVDAKENALHGKVSGTPPLSLRQGRRPLGVVQASFPVAFCPTPTRAKVSKVPAASVQVSRGSSPSPVSLQREAATAEPYVSLTPPRVAQASNGHAALPEVPMLPFEVRNTFVDVDLPAWVPLSPAAGREPPHTEPKSFKPEVWFPDTKSLADCLPSPIALAAEGATPLGADTDKWTMENTASPVYMPKRVAVPCIPGSWASCTCGPGAFEETFFGSSSVLDSSVADLSTLFGEKWPESSDRWSAGVMNLSLDDCLSNLIGHQPTCDLNSSLTSSSAAVLRIAPHLPPTPPRVKVSVFDALVEEEDLPPRRLQFDA